MSKHRSQSQPRIAVDDGPAIILDVETASDEVYGALANERRRQVLTVLTQEPMAIGVRDLARRIALQESSGTTGSVTEETITQVQVSLYHLHLPKLADLDLISYDAEQETVEGTTATNTSVHV